MVALEAAAAQGRLRQLDVSGNGGLRERGWAVVGRLVHKGLEELSASFCGLTDAFMVALEAAAAQGRLRKLDITNNGGLGGRGWAAVGRFVHKGLEELSASFCGLTDAFMVALEAAAAQGRLR